MLLQKAPMRMVLAVAVLIRAVIDVFVIFVER